MIFKLASEKRVEERAGEGLGGEGGMTIALLPVPCCWVNVPWVLPPQGLCASSALCLHVNPSAQLWVPLLQEAVLIYSECVPCPSVTWDDLSYGLLPRGPPCDTRDHRRLSCVRSCVYGDLNQAAWEGPQGAIYGPVQCVADV